MFFKNVFTDRIKETSLNSGRKYYSNEIDKVYFVFASFQRPIHRIIARIRNTILARVGTS